LLLLLVGGRYIGKEGIHMNPTRWASEGYNDVVFEEVPQDSIRKKFELFRYVKAPSGDMNSAESESNKIYI